MKKIKIIIISILLILILPIFIINSVIIINSYIKPDKIPSFFGWKPFIVLSGSMETQINTGDLVIVKETDNNNLKEGDIVAFKTENVVITHRIVEKTEDEGKIQYKTKGDNNNTIDNGYITPEQIEGIYQFKISKLGNVAMFIQTPLGMITCLSIPIILMILVQMSESKEKQKHMEEEIEKLKNKNKELTKINKWLRAKAIKIKL